MTRHPSSTSSPPPFRRRGRRRHNLAIAVVLGLAGALLSVGAAEANHTVSLSGSNFEIDEDANLTVEHTSPPSLDWGNVNDDRKLDTASGTQDESFGQGTKEDTAVPSVVNGSIPPNKSDLKAFGVYQEGSTSSGFLNMFWSRVQDPSGTTNMDFEFNQRQCTPNLTPADADCTSNGITPIRTSGDLLIIYDLSQGGTHPTLSLREWTGSAWGSVQDLTSSNKATGSINTSAISSGNSDGLGALDPRTFGEAQIALASIFDDPSTCQSFGSVYLKSRSSDSFTAAVKDFVPPKAVNISNCGSVKIIKKDDSNNALSGAEFTLYKDLAPTGGSRGSEDTITSYKCTSSVADGTCTITNVPVGSYWVHETVVPSGYTAADDQLISVTASTTVEVTFVDNLIRLTPTLSSAQKFTPNDSATVAVTNNVHGNPTGSVKFQLFSGSSCGADADALYTETVNLPGDALSQTVSTNNTSYFVTAEAANNLSWKISFTSTKTPRIASGSSCKEVSTVTIDNDNTTP